MSSWVSKNGVWYPAKEHAVLPHLSGTDKEVYDGPDRAAELELAQIHGVDTEGKPKQRTVGMEFKYDPDLINRAKQLGFKDVMEYAEAFGYDMAKAEQFFKEHTAEVVKHKEAERKPELSVVGGGIDTSGKGSDFIGGFGDERARPASEIK